MAQTTKSKAKLPVQQLTILGLLRLAEPVALTSVFPYLPELMEFVRVPPESIAFYAGLTSATFSISQFLTGVLWGRISDIYGRKPILLIALTCAMVSSLLFGLSTSLAWAITARIIGGLSNGNVGILRTVVAEMVPQRELQPKAFSVMPLVWSIGSILGPSFGGALAEPAQKYPQIFGGVWFWERFPFLLPNLAASVLFLIGLAIGILFLNETLESKKHRTDYGLILGQKLIGFFRRIFSKKPSDPISASEQRPLLHKRYSLQEESFPDPTQSVGWTEVFSKQSSLNLVVYSFLALNSVASDQLLPIFLHYPIKDRRTGSNFLQFTTGFGLSSSTIGLLYTMIGISAMLIQIFAFPRVAARFGILNTLKGTMILFPILNICTPFTALLPNSAARFAALGVILVVRIGAVIHAFPSAVILLTHSAATPALLGTLNGIATSTSALGRASGPFIAGYMDMLGRRQGYAVLPWFTLAALAIIGAIPAWWIRDEEQLVIDKSGADRSRDCFEEGQHNGRTSENSRFTTSPLLEGHNANSDSEPPLKKLNSNASGRSKTSNLMGGTGPMNVIGGGSKASNHLGSFE